jgi:hypothetical protein
MVTLTMDYVVIQSKPLDQQKLSQYTATTVKKSKREKEAEVAEAKRKAEEEQAAKVRILQNKKYRDPEPAWYRRISIFWMPSKETAPVQARVAADLFGLLQMMTAKTVCISPLQLLVRDVKNRIDLLLMMKKK